DRQDDEFLVDTVQVLRAVIRERPNDIEALRQEVVWEDAARVYARVYIRIRDANGATIVETPGSDAILAGQTLAAAPVDGDPGPGVRAESATRSPLLMMAGWAPVTGAAGEPRLIQAVLDRSAEERLLNEYRLRLWTVLGLALFGAVAAGYGIA